MQSSPSMVCATDRIKILKQTPLFADLKDSEARSALCVLCTVVEFEPGDYLLIQSQKPTHSFVIFDGTAHVFRISKTGVKSTMALLGVGDVVGELSLLDGGDASATVIAMETVCALKISNTDFLEFLHAHNGVAVDLMQVLVQRLRSANQQTEEMHGTKLSTRTLHVLKTLEHLHGAKTVTISQAELAPLIGASRPRVTEALQELEAQGKISRKWRSITLIH